MCRVPCTHLRKVQDSPIWIWKGLQNARLFIIIGGSLQKLAMEGGLLHNHKIRKLELKLYLSSQMQHLTLFYFGFVCNLSTLYYTNIYKKNYNSWWYILWEMMLGTSWKHLWEIFVYNSLWYILFITFSGIFCL